MYLQKSFDLKEVYKIMSFRDEMYLITFPKGLQVLYDFLNQYKVGDGKRH